MNIIKKAGVLLLLIIVAIIMAGIYGMLHDQFTYSISPEYYTKFKFYQFGFMDRGSEAIFPYPRLQVAAVGWLASWWMGIPIGLILGLAGMIHRDWRTMWRITIRAFFITLTITLLAGLIGLADGHFYRAQLPRESLYDWYLPNNLVDYRNFVKVGSMHNYSYFGGLLGLIAGLVYSIRKRNGH